jgi:hypothetical protein
MMADPPYGLGPTGQPAPMQDGDFTPAARNQEVHFATCEIDPPSQNYIDVDDVFVLSYLPFGTENSGPTCNLRILRPKGQIELVQFQAPATSGNSLASVTVRTREGYLLSAEVTTGALGGTGWFEYVMLAIRRGGSAVVNEQRLLIADYISPNVGVGWPERPTQRPAAGPGAIASLAVGNPSAGADWVFTNASTQRFLCNFVCATLAAANSGSARTVTLQISDGANNMALIDCPTTQAINTTVTYSGMSGGFSGGTAGLHLYWPLPTSVMIGTNWKIGTITGGIQAGDQWSAIRLGGLLWADLL